MARMPGQCKGQCNTTSRVGLRALLGHVLCVLDCSLLRCDLPNPEKDVRCL